jgi:microcystin-dependent protein
MLKKSLKSKSVKSMCALLSASALVMAVGLSQSVQASEPFIAEIKMFGGNFAPRGYALCEGQLLSINTNQSLFSVLGTTYGGDGRTTFGLPDLRGRSPVGEGQGPGLSDIDLGQKGGSETNTITVNNMPSHTHAATTTATATLKGTNAAGNSSLPGGHILASKRRTNIYSDAAVPDVDMNAASVDVAVTVTNVDTGDGSAINNRSPFQAVNFIIALEGLFPSRN